MSVPWVFFLFITPIRAKPIADTTTALVRCEPLLTSAPATAPAQSTGESFGERLGLVFDPIQIEELAEQRQTSPLENSFWMERNSPTLESLPPHMAFVFEIPVVKQMNDGILVGQKNLVNILLNFLKSRLKSNLLDALPEGLDLHWYSDFKSLGLLIDQTGEAVSERALRSLVFESVQRSLSEFDHLIGTTSPHMGFYRSVNPSSWLTVGGGYSPQYASAAARLARYAVTPTADSHPAHPVFWFHEEGEFHLNSQLLPELEVRRKLLISFLSQEYPHLLIPSAEAEVSAWKALGAVTFHREIFRALRTSSSLKEFQEHLVLRFPQLHGGHEEFAAVQIWNYYKLLDQLSPPIYFENRTYASLSPSEVGGASLDFIGLGALNAMGVDLALSEFFAGSQFSSSIISLVQRRERELTTFVQNQRETLRSLLAETMEEVGGTAGDGRLSCSADDCALTFYAPNEDSREVVFERTQAMVAPLLGKFQTMLLTNFRVVMVGNFNTPSDQKDPIVGHGELIEKKWRGRLYELGLTNTEQSALIAVFLMRGESAGTGSVDIYYVTDGQGDRALRNSMASALNDVLVETNAKMNWGYTAGEVIEVSGATLVL